MDKRATTLNNQVMRNNTKVDEASVFLIFLMLPLGEKRKNGAYNTNIMIII